MNTPCAITALTLLTLALPVIAHVGDTVYPVYELPASQLPDLHDGTLADWEEVLPGASVDFNDFFSDPRIGDGAPISADDLAYRFFLAWHGATGRLYVGFERVDDAYVNEYDGGKVRDMLSQDNFELFVDADHSGGAYNGFSEDADRLTGAQAQQYVVLPESPDGLPLRSFRGFCCDSPAWVSQPPFADAGGAVVDGTPAFAVAELYVTPFDDLDVLEPEQSVPSTLAADRIIGFALNVADFDTGPGKYHGFHTLTGESETWRTADLFVDGLLIGCDSEDCGQAPPASAVAADSWGRIKASFRQGF